VKFADTSWWVAWSLAGDRNHAAAVAVLDRLGPAEQVLTTNHVLEETWTFLSRKAGHRAAFGCLDRAVSLQGLDRLVVHRVDEGQEDAAWAWLRRHDERAYSFVDATSFTVMRQRRLREALAFDQDFAAAGFVELRP
jgi:predicted nucleic acid-binding protein